MSYLIYKRKPDHLEVEVTENSEIWSLIYGSWIHMQDPLCPGISSASIAGCYKHKFGSCYNCVNPGLDY